MTDAFPNEVPECSLPRDLLVPAVEVVAGAVPEWSSDPPRGSDEEPAATTRHHHVGIVGDLRGDQPIGGEPELAP